MNRQRIRWMLVFCALLVIALAPAGVAYAQDPVEGETGAPEEEVIGDPAWYPEEIDHDAELQAAEADIVLAQPPYTMNYQGYVTNAAGEPLSGSYDMTASLWNAAAAGLQRWGPEAHAAVVVSKGLFNLVLGETTPLAPSVFNEALYLELSVGTTTLPRQPLRATAYAYGLVPGAEVRGDPEGTSYGLTVQNTGIGASDSGLYASGNQYGMYVRETGTGDVAIYSQDYINSLGYRSRLDSYLFIPGNVGNALGDVVGNSLEVSYQSNGHVALKNTVGSGTRYFYMPINTPAVLFGQNVTVEQVTVYYDLTSANSFITTTTLRKQTGAGLITATDLVNDNTDRKSTSPTSYSNTPVNATLSATEGGLQLRLVLTFANTGDTIYIGGVRLRLGHTRSEARHETATQHEHA